MGDIVEESVGCFFVTFGCVVIISIPIFVVIIIVAVILSAVGYRP